jgi:hypothetical protein
MFDVYCPRHQSRILLYLDNIHALVNGPDGVEISWRCGCGQTGTERFGPSVSRHDRGAA